MRLSKLRPEQVLWLSLAAALVTMALKTLAWYLTGSVGYLSDAMESVVNLLGSGFALAMFTYARRPADAGHPFGHGKAEYFAAAFEGGMIFLAALAILFAAGERLINPRPLEAINLGTSLIVLASLINLVVARLLLRLGRMHRSPALEGDGRHLMADVWTTVGVVIGVGLAHVTGLYWLDPLLAIAVALHILYEGWGLLARSANGLMDRSLSPEKVRQIEALLETHCPDQCRFVQLRTRAAGAQQFAQVALVVPESWSVREAFAVADSVEQALRRQAVVMSVHIEPGGDER